MVESCKKTPPEELLVEHLKRIDDKLMELELEVARIGDKVFNRK